MDRRHDDGEPEGAPEEAPRGSRYAGYQAAAVAWNLGWPIAAGVLVGSWLDDRLGSSPALVLVFSLGALVATVRRLLALSRQGRRNGEQDED